MGKDAEQWHRNMRITVDRALCPVQWRKQVAEAPNKEDCNDCFERNRWGKYKKRQLHRICWDFNFEVVSHTGQSGHYLEPNIFYELTDVETVINNSPEVYTSNFRYLQVKAKRINQAVEGFIHHTFPLKKFQTSAVQKTESHWFKSLSLQKDK